MLKQAHLAIKLRALLKADDWKAVVATLRGIADAMLKSMEEVEAAWSEVNDKCAEFEAALECALAAGRSKRVADGKAYLEFGDDEQHMLTISATPEHIVTLLLKAAAKVIEHTEEVSA